MPDGITPEGEKPKIKRRRTKKAKPQAETIPASTPAPARFVSVERQVPAKRKKSSWLFSALQILFAIIVIIGAYALFHQVRKVQEEAKKREAVLEEQLRNQVGAVQDKFDTLINTWQQQKADEELATARVEYSIESTPIKGSYLARVGELSQVSGKYVFAANPDLWGQIDSEVDSCRRPLVVDETGYCDAFSIDGFVAIERVLVEKNDDDEIVRVLKQVTIEYADEKAFQWVVDLGTPVIEGRDVFAPVDAEAQNEAITQYIRAILKHEDLPEVLEENLQVFDDLIDHLRLR